MPRIVSNAELLKRGARLKGGAALDEHRAKAPEPEPQMPEPSPVVAAPTMDIAPMAAAVDRMTETVGQAMQAQSEALQTIVAHQQKPAVFPAWEFRVTYNSDGRIDRINAKTT